MDQQVTFTRDIRPLFNERDVSAMSSRFDLSSYDDVHANAERIYERLAGGTMPCYESDETNIRELAALTGETLDALHLAADPPCR